MKLVRFATSDTGSKPGIMVDDRIIALGELFPEAPTDLIGVIECWEEIKGPLARRIKEREGSPVRNPTLLAPIARPGKILAIGLNYADHIEEAKAAGVKIPTEQVWFCKQPTSVNSPFGGIHKPIVSDQLDYEVELVVVIGKKGRRISAQQAPDHVFGYTIGNDVSVRDWQQKTPQWMLGKSFDTHCPFGPHSYGRRNHGSARAGGALFRQWRIASKLEYPASRLQHLATDRRAFAGHDA